MLNITLATLLVSTALAGSALAQAAPTMGSAAFVTEQATTEFRASKFVGLDVYGSDNEKIGEIKEILIATDGQAKGAVLAVGGFLGIGEKNVAVAWTALKWSNDRPVARAAANPSSTMTGNPAMTGSTTMSGTVAPMTTGAPASGATTAPARSPAEQAAYDGYPNHATANLTKADLQNAPAFKYYAETHPASNAAGTATSPARP